MKIIALYPFLREELNLRFLKISINTLNKIADEIIILIDFHNDDLNINLNFLKKNKKIKIYYEKSSERVTNAPRNTLLQLGRKNQGTHFIWLDCDEAFTYPFSKNGRQIISRLKEGEKIQMRWLSIWKDYRYYRSDKKSIWSNLYKDFIVYDKKNYKFNSKVLHESRTQGPNTKKNTIFLDINQGAVMHYQFINWKNFLLKQAYYMCSELIKMKKTTFQINRKYFYTYFENFPKLNMINKYWLKDLDKRKFKDLYFDTSDYWKYKFKLFFDKHNIILFKNLFIWNNSVLRRIFFEKEKKNPKLNFLNKINIFLFILLEICRYFKKFFF
jgi:hypothetical protein